MDRELRIMIGNRLVAQLTRIPQTNGDVLLQYTVWFSADLNPDEREIIVRTYLNELLKGS